MHVGRGSGVLSLLGLVAISPRASNVNTACENAHKTPSQRQPGSKRQVVVDVPNYTDMSNMLVNPHLSEMQT